jgi:glucokinase
LAEVNTLAIDIGGTKFTLALFEGANLARRESRPTQRERGRDWMVEQITGIAREWSFERCGIGFGGPVDFARQTVALSTHVAGWNDFPLAGHLRETLGVPVVMDNDANVGALGEGVYGAGQGARPLLYVTLSTGIGGGILLDAENRVYRGADSWAGEIGHLTVAGYGSAEGPECQCGSRGCLEALCGGMALEGRYGKSAHELLKDPAFVAAYVVPLAQGLKAAIMLLNPARIVIGGGIAKAGDALFEPLRVELRRQMPAWSRARLDVVPARLGDNPGDDSVLWGAYVLAIS